MKILVVDDEDGLRKLLLKILSRGGYNAAGVNNGKEAVRAFRSDFYDIVITDIFMPEKDGLETILELRNLYPDLKIIAISGGGMNGLGNHLSYAKVFGAQEIFPKPVDPKEILLAVDRIAGELV